MDNKITQNEFDLTEIQAHIEKLKEYQKKKLNDDAKEKLDAEIKFWEDKLKG